jgi:hypothetical protein
MSETRKIILNLDDATFQYLEVLAVGLLEEEHDGDKHSNAFKKDLAAGHNKTKNDFGPLVSKMLEEITQSLADGVRRNGSWERGVVESLTGWESTVCPDMFGDKVTIETQNSH